MDGVGDNSGPRVLKVFAATAQRGHRWMKMKMKMTIPVPAQLIA
jgi:hypothetical protein